MLQTRALEHIQDQLQTDLDVAEIAGAVNSSHFIRFFKQAMGQSPYRCVIEARTKKARELLVSGKLSISEIAYQ